MAAFSSMNESSRQVICRITSTRSSDKCRPNVRWLVGVVVDTNKLMVDSYKDAIIYSFVTFYNVALIPVCVHTSNPPVNVPNRR